MGLYQTETAGKWEREISYRSRKGKQLGIVVCYFDGHGGWLSERESRLPDPWWSKGTGLPRSRINVNTFELVFETMLAAPETLYRVRR